MTGRLAATSARDERASLRVYVSDARALCGDVIDAVVTDEDRSRCHERMHARRRAEYLAGRALLRYALESSSYGAARSHRFRTQADGKPECVEGPAISVSHSENLIACAIAPCGEVGIDVQFPAARHNVSEIARRWFTSGEYAQLQGSPPEAFYRLWVLKEAYLKCLGSGLAGGLRSLECRIEPPFIALRAATAAHVALYSAGKAFLGIAASGAGFPSIQVEHWPPACAYAAEHSIGFIATSERF